MTFTQNIMKETVMERHEIWLRLRRPALQAREFLFFWQAFQAASRAKSVWRNFKAVFITCWPFCVGR
jgi:hypothetical protein